MGRLWRWRGGARGASVEEELAALAQLEPFYSPERVRRRTRDIFFAVQQSWTLRDFELAAPYVSEGFLALHRARIGALLAAHQVHELESPLIEDLRLDSYTRAAEVEADPLLGPLPAARARPPTIDVVMSIRVVETLRDDRTGAILLGADGEHRRGEQWTLVHLADWCLSAVSVPGERRVRAPLVSDDVARLTPEVLLRERYARGEIELDELEQEMDRSLRRGPVY